MPAPASRAHRADVRPDRDTRPRPHTEQFVPITRSTASSCRSPIHRRSPESRRATNRHRLRLTPVSHQTKASTHGRKAECLRSFGRVLHAVSPDMARRAPLGAMVGVRAYEQPPATVIADNFVEIHVARTAQAARMRRADGAKR